MTNLLDQQRFPADTVLKPLLPSLLLRFATAVDLLCQAMAEVDFGYHVGYRCEYLISS